MKFLLDHDVPAEIAHLLRYWEHNVTALRTVLPVTASDEEVFDHACSQGLILISCNRDHFLTLARRTPDHPALIMVKFQQRYVKSHRKVPTTPSHLPCDLSWLPASSPTGGSSC